MVSNALIVGCGSVGQLIAKQLFDEGVNVYGISRTPYRLPTFIQGIAFDFNLSHSTLSLPNHFDVIYFCAAPDKASPESYQNIYYNCLPAIASWMHDQTKLIYASSTAVYAQNQGQKIDERSVTQPEGYRGQTLLRAEQWIEQHIPHASIIRFSGLYGKTNARLIRMMKEDKTQNMDLGRISNRIHIKDAARLMIHVAKQTNPEKLYLGSDSHPTSYWEIFKYLHSELQQPFDRQRPSQMSGKQILNHRTLGSGFSFLYPSYQEGFKNEFVSQ